MRAYKHARFWCASSELLGCTEAQQGLSFLPLSCLILSAIWIGFRYTLEDSLIWLINPYEDNESWSLSHHVMELSTLTLKLSEYTLLVTLLSFWWHFLLGFFLFSNSGADWSPSVAQTRPVNTQLWRDDSCLRLLLGFEDICCWARWKTGWFLAISCISLCIDPLLTAPSLSCMSVQSRLQIAITEARSIMRARLKHET